MMQNLNKKIWSVTALVIGCLFLGAFLFFSRFHPVRIIKIIFWPTIVLYIFLATYCLYKLEWKNILGLFRGNVTKKIMKQSFGKGLLLAAITNTIVMAILIIFGATISFPFNNETTFFEILFSVTMIAPIAEEIMFRGFIQGVLQKNYALNENKTRIKIIIVITTLLFTIAHVRYIVYTEPLQWILSLLGILITSLYLGYLRNKHQSIIPSIFAHFGFNLSWIVVGPITGLMVIIFQPVGFGKMQQQRNQMEFENDSIYNFDRNDWGELYNAQQKFFAFHNPPHPEFKPYITKGRTAFVEIFYDIDTCGIISNVRFDSLNSERENYTNIEIDKVAIRLVESFPQHKPFVKDGKKEEALCRAYVPIYY
jgi:membrane protease YdiL (CAAX protease family)